MIGGVPRSTLPLLLGLLLASAFLVAAALAQLRRETEVVHLRADFVANVSHELRTPLAQIQMFLDTLRMERARSPEERARFLEIAAREVRRLAQLVENVLQFARLERSAEHLRPEATDVSAELRDALAAFEPLARGRHAALVLEGTDQPVRALADRAALRQIILNLLDNAVKHGPKGQTIILGVERREHRVRLRVDDQGPGVSPADRERIFHPFVRADPGGRLGTSGTGIGLAVVRELAALQRGTVWVEDAPGGGARFVVELPAAREGAAVQARAGA